MSGSKDLRNFEKVALDTNIFIYYSNQDSEYTSYTNKIFTRLEKNKLKASTSLITLAELLALKAPENMVKILEESFLTTPNLSIVPFDQKIAIEAARIRRQYGFRLPDAIQLASAIEAGAQVFITNDLRLKPFLELEIVLLNKIK